MVDMCDRAVDNFSLHGNARAQRCLPARHRFLKSRTRAPGQRFMRDQAFIFHLLPRLPRNPRRETLRYTYEGSRNEGAARHVRRERKREPTSSNSESKSKSAERATAGTNRGRMCMNFYVGSPGAMILRRARRDYFSLAFSCVSHGFRQMRLVIKYTPCML